MQPFAAPVQLLMGDIPWPASVAAQQYTTFFAVANATGNYTVEIYFNSGVDSDGASNGRARRAVTGADAGVVLADLAVQPTLGQTQFQAKVPASRAWHALLCPFIRKNSRINITVFASNTASFDIRIQNA